MHDLTESCDEALELRLPSPVTPVNHPLLERKGLGLFIKRDDLIHPHLQGNKWRKLKYNIIDARQQDLDTLLTFGGAWSNHIHATAAAGHYCKFKTIGVIRGEHHQPLNPCLQDAHDWGMQLHYVDRKTYRKKTDPEFIRQLKALFGECYIIPEGGNNAPGIRGCSEIIGELEQAYDYICVDCGTGATLAGLIQAADASCHVMGFAVLKNADFIRRDVQQHLAKQSGAHSNNWSLQLDYHFGGYAKTSETLFEFIRKFQAQHHVQLEPVYSAKMFYGIFDLIERDFFKAGSRILAIHSGGLQGLRGFDEMGN